MLRFFSHHRPNSKTRCSSLKRDRTQSESVRTRGDEEPIIRAFEGETRPGSVGKLRISSEMKAKLEQLTMDHSVRSRASSRRRREDELPVAPTPTTPPGGDNRKLREERKLALERQLGFQDAASEAHSFRLDNLVKAKIQKMERRSQVRVPFRVYTLARL